ncbi:hypothetical protein [Azohydromonas lata]|uniref:Uncharacterized protein n=1 Tax=Azohydromonas lata TaxID=45677 RepID=A0ABU5IRK6_9BURK|nr:hypothetical protein [Azohydromonas lata]MDZ5461530.1 hypothetical protein [Azohydromonas lata]
MDAIRNNLGPQQQVVVDGAALTRALRAHVGAQVPVVLVERHAALASGGRALQAPRGCRGRSLMSAFLTQLAAWPRRRIVLEELKRLFYTSHPEFQKYAINQRRP